MSIRTDKCAEIALSENKRERSENEAWKRGGAAPPLINGEKIRSRRNALPDFAKFSNIARKFKFMAGFVVSRLTVARRQFDYSSAER